MRAESTSDLRRWRGEAVGSCACGARRVERTPVPAVAWPGGGDREDGLDFAESLNRVAEVRVTYRIRLAD